MKKATFSVAAGAAALALTSSLVTPASAHPLTPHGNKTLRHLAKKTDRIIGSAVAVQPLLEEADYRRTLNRHFNGVTAENAMKWGELEPQRGEYNWEPADAIVRSAIRNRQAVRGHTLVWHNQLPAWLTENEADFTDAELRAILRNHIFTVVKRYRGKIRAWDVVNEVVDDSGNMRDTIWLRRLGQGYIADAFRWAHQADPRAKLYLNDYNLEWGDAKADTTYNLVRDLKRQGVPIHGVGFQGHLAVQYGLPQNFPDTMARFTALRLEAAITEADVRMILPVTPEKLAIQVDLWKRLFGACIENRRCVEFTIWGYTDRHQWVPGWFEGEGSAAPFDENLRPKAGYYALWAAAREARTRG
jgi:endo-1,4-beta-xylanase